jgi:hypothetical protein
LLWQQWPTSVGSHPAPGPILDPSAQPSLHP